jgi:hypothetical protein
MITICPKERIDELVPLGERFFILAKEHGIFNPKSFVNFWVNVYNGNKGFVIVNVTDDKIDGALGLVIYDEFLTGDSVATELFLYSEGKGGLKLLDAAEDLSRKCGAKILYIQHLNDENSEKIIRHYIRRDFSLRYFRYTKEL